MQAQNSLVTKSDKLVEYGCNGETVKLSPSIIRSYLVNGEGNVSDQEVVMFLNLCRFQHLNPFLREAYLIKYGNSPATIVTGKEVFTKRAKRNKDYRGFEAGIIVVGESGLEHRVGTFKLPNEELVGGWAKVYIRDFEAPVEIAVSLEEYIGRKRDGEVNSQWKGKPSTMIRKVALVQALREAFPEDFQGMYGQEEFCEASELSLPVEPVSTEEEPVQETEPSDPLL